MKIFEARLLFRIRISGTDLLQYDEQHLIIESSSEQEAFCKLADYGKQEEESFVNSKGHIVSWVFMGVVTLNPLNFKNRIAIAEGRTYQPDHSENFEQSFIQKSTMLEKAYRGVEDSAFAGR